VSRFVYFEKSFKKKRESILIEYISSVHFHIIPKPNEKDGLGVGWPSEKGDEKELTALQTKITDALKED
jgi:diadenosine tetraphosphate (Ap4A) HIT family hydrolase